MPFAIASKILKFWDASDKRCIRSYAENDKMMRRDIKEGKRKNRKDILCSLFSWIGRLTIVNVNSSLVDQ